MKVAYISSAEFGCPAPTNRIQAALWVCQQVIEGMTNLGHETIYIGAGTSTVKATEIVSMGPAFFDLYPYDEWVTYTVAEKDRTLTAYQSKLQLFLIDYLQNHSVDLVHFHTSPPIFSLPYTRYIRQPKVHTFHDPLLPSYGHIFSSVQEVTSNNFVTISNAQRRGLPDVSYATTVYNGISMNNYPYERMSGTNLLFLGRIMRQKGPHTAVRVAQQVSMPLMLAGKFVASSKEFLATSVTPFIDGDSIKHVGVVELNEKIALIQHARCLLFPIEWEEPFGLVMIEAMACGTPVVAYNRGSVPEIVKDGVTGFIVDPSEEEQRAQDQQDLQYKRNYGQWIIKKRGIEGLVEAVRRIGEIDRKACRKHVEDNFTVEKMVEGYERVYKKVLRI